MRLALKINWILITLLSLSTGIFKILQQEADIQLFEKIGMNATLTTIFGVVQLIGGIFLISNKTRTIGAWIMTTTFIIASVAVFMNKMYFFGAVSLLFILMAYLVVYMDKTRIT